MSCLPVLYLYLLLNSSLVSSRPSTYHHLLPSAHSMAGPSVRCRRPFTHHDLLPPPVSTAGPRSLCSWPLEFFQTYTSKFGSYVLVNCSASNVSSSVIFIKFNEYYRTISENLSNSSKNARLTNLLLSFRIPPGAAVPTRHSPHKE